mmetsp:Transcript_99314/g.286595  ORF Transcript_99314/g.286595 Transcript_99314/m.286595 type:complete len:400 (+) Transcript_99314:598-1797(+)
MDRAHTVTAVIQGLRQHIHGLLLVDEDDDRRLGAHQELLQSLLLLRFTDEFKTLLNVLLGVARIADADDGRTSQEVPRHALNCWRHRGAKHLCDPVPAVAIFRLQLLLEGLVLLLGLHVRAGNGQQHSPHIVLESQVDHLVGLVDDHVVALVEDRVPLVQGIAQASRGGEADFRALPQGERLLLCVAAADNADHADIAKVCELPRLLLDLQHQLSARGQNDAVWPVHGCGVVEWRQLLHIREQWQHVGGRLPTSGLGYGDEIPVLASDRNGLHLDGCRPRVAHLVDGLQQLPRQRALGPNAHRVRHSAATNENLEVLAEDSPISSRHLVDGLLCPMDLVVVLGLDVALLEPNGFLRRLDESGDVLAGVLGPLRDQLLIEAVILALLTHIDARPVAAPKQ